MLFPNQTSAVGIWLVFLLPQFGSAEPVVSSAAAAPKYLTAADFTIEGMPQQQYNLNATFEQGVLQRIDFAGSVGYIIVPKGKVDERRRWVWVVPLWLAVPSHYGDVLARYYVEDLLAKGFHVVGFDVGATLGSPKGAELFARFHEHVIREYKLAPKARMLAVSNGGLITYGYGFRYPDRIDRICAIYPALDFRSWPKFELVVGPGAITPKGLAYELTPDEMKSRTSEFNPIDNLKPLADARVPLFHLHGDADELVPLEPNSGVAANRYRQFGGNLKLKILPGTGHGGTECFKNDDALEFLRDKSPALPDKQPL
ncbi:MAG: prolyl oligopeptidase family serine peptidase [Planctomycetota bacterium]|nr:prolyl oligopeptidase family serine peptidase [Planctomycetota bacterium]